MLDDAAGKWGLRVNRVEIKAIEPPQSIKDAMEKQMRAERDKRAVILGAEGQRQSQILTAEGEKQAAVLARKATGPPRSSRRRARHGSSTRSSRLSNATTPTPNCSPTSASQTLPQLAQSPVNTFWVIPGEVTSALQDVSRAFSEVLPQSAATRRSSSDDLAIQAANDAAKAAGAAAEALAGAAEADSATTGALPSSLEAAERHHQPETRPAGPPD